MDQITSKCGETTVYPAATVLGIVSNLGILQGTQEDMAGYMQTCHFIKRNSDG